jgi:hypothetical protein
MGYKDREVPGQFRSNQGLVPQYIAVNRSVRDLHRLNKRYGRGRWRKLKGFAKVKLPDGSMVRAGIHWYERMELADARSKSKVRHRNSRPVSESRFVVCITETGGVQRGKVYKVVPDLFARKHKLIRIIDEGYL